MLRSISDALRGPAQARAAHRQALKLNPGIRLGIRQLQALCPTPENPADDAPIFLLSAGWRSGSTMLQRLLMSDPHVLIWGEPYDECGLVQALADCAKGFRPGWPPADYFHDGRPGSELSGEWIANLFPSLDDWRRSQRALLDTLFAEPARRAGAHRWGIKEVRLTSEHALFLRWLYPNARFLLLYRHPLEAYRSYCSFGRSWYEFFPDQPMFTPRAFGAHWQRLMQGFLDDAQELDAMLVKYEDLVAGRFELETIDCHLGITTDHTVMTRKVRGTMNAAEKGHVNALERWLLRRAVGSLASQLGYTW